MGASCCAASSGDVAVTNDGLDAELQFTIDLNGRGQGCAPGRVLLEKRHVEHVVTLPRRRQLQFISNGTNTLEDFEGATPARRELACAVLLERNVLGVKKNGGADGMFNVPVFLVVVGGRLGYTAEHNSWEPESSLRADAPVIVDRYLLNPTDMTKPPTATDAA